MLLLRLPRETGNQSCTKDDIRDLFSQSTDDIQKLGFRRAASHTSENRIVGVLDRKVQVMTDFFLFFHNLDELRINLLGIAVENPDPADAFDLTELLEKLMKALLAVEILSVKSGLLCYQNQLLHTLLRQRLRLLKEALHRNTPVISADLRDDAVSTVLVAALCDL